MALDHNTAAAAAPDESLRHRDVLLELEKAGQSQTGWGKGLLLLLVSLVAFVAVGFAQSSSWEVLAILVGILFVHELGHFLAMRIFKYRNVRMFFIPFFGAAVTGQNFNVPGWKKVIVSLMGPLPGILLGGIIGGIGLALHNGLMIRIGLMAVIINGFNLLPVLPLDGGWIAHSVLFSRHHLLDCAFRVFAALGLIAIGILSQSRFLAYVAIPMLLGIGVAYKLSRISRELKQRGLPQASSDAQTIPPETALAIIDAVRDEIPNAQTPKAAAQHTLQIFETLNAKPPGWAASLGLLSVHLGAFLLAVLFAALFIVGQQGSLRGFITAAATGPKEILQTETLARIKYGESGKSFDAGRITIVADCARNEQASLAFDTLFSRVPKTGALRLFGKTLLMALPGGQDDLRKEWLAELQRHATNVFVTSTGFVASVSLSCVAMTDSNAVALQEEAQAYFSARAQYFQLIAPWDDSDRRSVEEKQAHLVARQTYLKLLRTTSDLYSAPEALVLRRKISNATRQGDQVLAKTLSAEERALNKQLQQRAIEKLRPEGKVDTTLIDLYASLPENYWTNKQTKVTFRDMGARMGQLALSNGEPSAEATRFSASGSVERNGLLVSFNWVFFDNVFEGAPAFAAWLDQRGCKDIRYQFHGGSDLEERDY